MKIAVLSGKGGTGKTMVSVNLSAVAKNSIYVDCDVEEPNGYLFLKPKNIQEKQVNVRLPRVDKNLCNGCRKCVEMCKFNALSYIKKGLMIFDDVCHSCGGCILVCPENALNEKEKSIGKIQKGISNDITSLTGILNTGEATGIPIIRELLDEIKSNNESEIFIDCPPGSACIVMESIKDADYCVLVAEPTLFGAHNLNMVYELVKLFKKPFGVVLNKCLDYENPSEEFCKKNNIKILAKIPFDKNLGELNSNAEIIVHKNIKYKKLFCELLNTLKMEVQNEATSNS